jgi:CDP-diacylglycerol pyrophosphatase
MNPLFTEEEIDKMCDFEWVQYNSTGTAYWYAHHGDKSVYAKIYYFQFLYQVHIVDDKTREFTLRNHFIDLYSAKNFVSESYRNELKQWNIRLNSIVI